MRRPIPDRYAPEHRDPALQTPGVLPTPRMTATLIHGANGSRFRISGEPDAPWRKLRPPRMRDVKRTRKWRSAVLPVGGIRGHK